MPRRPALWVLDSSILIAYLRLGKYQRFLLTELRRGTVLVPGVVLCELYAGAASHEDRADLERLRRALGPSVLETRSDDWVLAGRCLAYYAGRWGRIKPRDHIVDVLVAVNAAQLRAGLASEDLQQMRRWSWVLEKLGRRVEIERIVE